MIQAGSVKGSTPAQEGVAHSKFVCNPGNASSRICRFWICLLGYQRYRGLLVTHKSALCSILQESSTC